MSIQYQALKHITNATKPYRGSTNRFPLSKRSQSYKYFLVDQLDGEVVYRIVYGKRYKQVFIEDDQVKLYEVMGKNVVKPVAEDVKPYFYEELPNELGIVRPDNTFEFTMSSLSQGNSMILNNHMRGYVYRDSRRGGYVYNSYDSFHPVFEGLRFQLDDTKNVHESSKYEISGYSVSRKNAKHLTAQYQTMFKVSETIAKVISPQDFAMIICELYKEVIGIDLLNHNSTYYLGQLDRDTAVKAAEERLQSAPLDALILNGIASDSINGFSPYKIRGVMQHIVNNNGSSYYDRPSDPISMVDIVKRRLSKELYRRNPDVLKKREHTAGVIYPQSDWGFTITVNGNEVKQY